MNIALDWFMEYGMSDDLDFRTLRNVLDPDFIAFAKSAGTNEERKHIDECVERLKRPPCESAK